MRCLLSFFSVLCLVQASWANTTSHAFLVTNSNSVNDTSVHIINSSGKPQTFTGTLHAGSGEHLGQAELSLHNGEVAPHGRIILDATDLESLFEVVPWAGPAMLRIKGQFRFDVLTELTSPSGLKSNTNCVRQDAVHNIEGADSPNLSYVRLINIGDTTISSIRGSLVDTAGQTVGEAHVTLKSSLAPYEQAWLTRDDLEQLTRDAWTDEASLILTAPHPNLRLLNLNYTTAQTFFNFSCYEDEEKAALLLVTNAASVNESALHLVNSSAEPGSFSGTLVTSDGARSQLTELTQSISLGGRARLNASALETLLGVDTWSGPAVVELAGPDEFDAMIKLTSPSGLISNTNCVRQSAVHLVGGPASDVLTYVRFINTGTETITGIKGTLYDAAGMVLGNPDEPLMDSLAPGAQQFLNANELSSLMDVDWDGAATLVVTAENDEQLVLLNLNLVGGSTFFNFSCYENSDRNQATDASSWYEERLEVPVVESNCMACHIDGGDAMTSSLVFDTSLDNQATLSDYISTQGDSLLSTLQDSAHLNTAQVTPGSQAYRDFVGYLRLQGINVDPEFAGSIVAVASFSGAVAPISNNVGHPAFMSPHVRPITAISDFVYTVNTPADTVDVIDISSRAVVNRIVVGVDPVGLALNPDGTELWVANHISDTVSVIDTDPDSQTWHQVTATVQDLDLDTLSTTFDEPLGIAFGNEKAFITLGPANEVAVVDSETYEVSSRLEIRAQDPRALTVKDNRLYVVAFESNNQTQLSGCTLSKIDGDLCTFDAVQHSFTTNNVLSTFVDADIVRNPDLPDRDLFVFDTDTEALVEVVDNIGTLLYGIAVDSEHNVYVAQTEARNDANGRAGTMKHGLAEMGNRAFLNQVTRVDCGESCQTPTRFELEPLPPTHPAQGEALATPYAIEVSGQTLYVTAAGSDKLVTIDSGSGAILDRTDVGAVPRGIALTENSEAYVYNAVDNSVSVVDITDTAALSVLATIQLEDPTDSTVKAGRRLFNDASMSTSGTFSCESCHPDGHTDQLLWVLDTPRCDLAGCTQIPPRLTMPVRGARDTEPYHWDGIPGDPFGGNNTASINAAVDPNCTDAEGCARVLVDGSLATTMCEVGQCGTNQSGQAGALNDEERSLLAQFVLSVPYPPSPTRSFNNVLSETAKDGFFNFNYVNNASGRATGAQTCGNCHLTPFLVSTNTPGTGMDAPTWRGAYDRWMILPQGRINIADLLNIVNMDDSFPEQDMWTLAGSTLSNWHMVIEGSTGYPGAFARQVTLNQRTAETDLTRQLLETYEQAATDATIVLQGEGVLINGTEVTAVGLDFVNDLYRVRNGTSMYTQPELLKLAASGELLLTLTGRSGESVSYHAPQPAIWPDRNIWQQTRNVEIPFLGSDDSLVFRARHLSAARSIFVNGSRTSGQVACVTGNMPDCQDERVQVVLDEPPPEGGLHFLQLMNDGGLISNDMMFFSEQAPQPPRPGNLISSGGSFSTGQFDEHWNTVELVTNSIRVFGGEVLISLRETSTEPWRAQISHSVMVTAGQEYTLCYEARSTGSRWMTAYLDTNLDGYRNLSGGQFRSSLSSSMQSFAHTFTVEETDLRARVAFDFAQNTASVFIDNVGLYEGTGCGSP